MIRVYNALIYGLAGLAGIVVAGVSLIIAYDVAARNLGFQPPASTVALTEYALLYFTMAAAPYLVRIRGHIVVEVVYQRLGPRVQRRLDRAILLLCIAISFVVAAVAGVLLAEAWGRGEVEIRSLDTPRWILFAPLAVGFTLMALEFLRLLVLGESVFRAGSESREGF